MPVKHFIGTAHLDAVALDPSQGCQIYFCQGAKSNPEKSQILRQGTKKGQPFFPNL